MSILLSAQKGDSFFSSCAALSEQNLWGTFMNVFRRCSNTVMRSTASQEVTKVAQAGVCCQIVKSEHKVTEKCVENCAL